MTCSNFDPVLVRRLTFHFRPDFTNTEPAANIGPFPQWADKKRIVSMDPLGHLAPWLFKDTIEKENGETRWTRNTVQGYKLTLYS
jgi:hypothetical protein